MGLLDWIKERASAGKAAKPMDGFIVKADDPLHAEHLLINALFEEFQEKSRVQGGWHYGFDEYETMQRIEQMDRDALARLAGALAPRLALLDERADQFRAKSPNYYYDPKLREEWESVWTPRIFLFSVLERVLRRKPPLLRETKRALLECCAGSAQVSSLWHPLSAVVNVAEDLVNTEGLLPEYETLISRLLSKLQVHPHAAKEARKYITRLQNLIGQAPPLPIEPGEAWSDRAIADIAELDGPQRKVWIDLLIHCRMADGATPSKKWLKQAETLLSAIEPQTFREFVTRWFSLTEKRRNESALSLQQWNARCATQELYRRWGELMARIPARAFHSIRDAMTAAPDPWLFLRDFQNQPAVRAVFGDNAPNLQIPEHPPEFDPPEDLLITEPHMDVLRGLAWTCGLREDPEVARALTTLALSAYRKVPGKGPRAVRVGNASVTALGMMPGMDAVGQLALLKVKVKFGSAQAALEKALTASAERAGIPREDMEEMAVPAYGLAEVGRRVEQIGDFSAELSIAGSRDVNITWRRTDGKIQKALPAAAKKEFAEDLKELTAAKKDIEKMLPAQAERLDNLFLQQKSWPLQTWLERYLEHPLVGTLTRRLIWNFTTDGKTTPGIWLNGKLVDRLANPIPLEAKSTTLSLWHPLNQSPDVVLGWRAFLEEWQIQQPFKQAHREVYLLTPAEEATRVYSNRFAAHILKQHQFNALCAARGWKNKLRLMVDDTYPPASRLLPQWGLRAEFWIEGAGDNYGTDTNESGTYLYLSTDQVRFYRIDAQQLYAHAGGGGYSAGWNRVAIDEPLPLAEVPPLVFSEIMRDVDLFVGVASVGNDPNWMDAGRRDTEQTYWQRYSFGELSTSAQNRKEILQRLVPKLKIAQRCSFTDKFLVVQGQLRTYKIHLGSANILMSPNDQYLCIVPGRGKTEDGGGKVFLPFEGDQTLSVILSKAFLLAGDAKIKDSSITRQIRA